MEAVLVATLLLALWLATAEPRTAGTARFQSFVDDEAASDADGGVPG